MPRVFISYRREDPDTAVQHIVRRLRAGLGHENVFIDTFWIGGVGTPLRRWSPR